MAECRHVLRLHYTEPHETREDETALFLTLSLDVVEVMFVLCRVGAKRLTRASDTVYMDGCGASGVNRVSVRGHVLHQ